MMHHALSAAGVSCGSVASQGYSDAAHFVSKQAMEWCRRLQESSAIGLGGKGSFNELYEVYREAIMPNWDGYGALAVSETTYLCACQFLNALPLGTPAPAFGAEPDGHITIEWHRSPRWTLSVSVSPEGELHYSALLGSSKYYGTEPFIGEVPQLIWRLIRRIGLP